MILKNLKICIKEASDASFAGFSFINCDLSESNFEHSNLQAVKFINCNLTLACFYGANLTQTDFSKSILKGAEFEEATLHATNFQNTDLADALVLSDSNVFSCFWDGANVMNASFEDSDFVSKALNGQLPISGQPFLSNRGMFLQKGMDFANRNLINSEFTHSRISNTSFQNTNLSKSDFMYTTLENVDFQGADLCGAGFRDAKFTNVNLRNALYDRYTYGIPDHFKSDMIFKA
jgi:uncharacterized protein YjbI with pentapeptide repeats